MHVKYSPAMAPHAWETQCVADREKNVSVGPSFILFHCSFSQRWQLWLRWRGDSSRARQIKHRDTVCCKLNEGLKMLNNVWSKATETFFHTPPTSRIITAVDGSLWLWLRWRGDCSHARRIKLGDTVCCKLKGLKMLNNVRSKATESRTVNRQPFSIRLPPPE